MSTELRWLSNGDAIGLGWTLVHFAWQGAAVAAALAVARLLTRGRSSELRYALACAALVMLALLPVATFFVERSPGTSPSAMTAVSFVAPSSVDSPAAPAAPVIATGATTLPLIVTRRSVESILPYVVAAWLVGIGILSIRFAGALLVAGRLRRATRSVAAEWQARCDEIARSVGVRRAVVLCESWILDVPAVVGWLRPIVLVPAGVFVGLDARQIEAILAHELAHVRRYDYFVNLLQTAVETVLFYSPAVWWVSRVVREEREHCCDDVAVATCGDVLTYATALADLEDLRAGAPVLAMAATGGALARRIERILGRSPARAPISSNVLGALGAGAVALTIALAGSPVASKIHGRVPSPPAPPSTPAPPSPSSLPVPPSAPVAAALPFPATPSAPDAPGAAPVPPSDDVPESPEAPDDPDDQGDDADDTAATAAYADLGYANLTRSQRAAFRSQDVTPEYIRSLGELGYVHLAADRLIAMRVQDVDSASIRALQEAGYDRIPADTLIALHVHGVDAEFIRGLEEMGFAKLPLDVLIAFRVHGVNVDFIGEMRRAGYDDLSWENLVAARVHGVSASFASSWPELGYGHVPFDQLIALRVHGISNQYARDMRDIGLDPTIEQLVSLRVIGVSTDFARAVVAREGKVSIDRLIELRTHDDR